MVTQYVSYYTFGWNSDGKLTFIPVLAVSQKQLVHGEACNVYVQEKPFEAAFRRHCTLLIADSAKWHLDNWGNAFIAPGLTVVDHVIKASCPALADTAMKMIKRIYELTDIT